LVQEKSIMQELFTTKVTGKTSHLSKSIVVHLKAKLVKKNSTLF